MTSANHEARMDDFRRVLRPIYDRADRRREAETADALNAWGAKEAGARPLVWEVKPLDAWEPASGSRWVGRTTPDIEPGDVAEVLGTWAAFLGLESRGDSYGDGSLTFESPKGTGQHVEVFGIVDLDAWQEIER